MHCHQKDSYKHTYVLNQLALYSKCDEFISIASLHWEYQLHTYRVTMEALHYLLLTS